MSKLRNRNDGPQADNRSTRIFPPASIPVPWLHSLHQPCSSKFPPHSPLSISIGEFGSIEYSYRHCSQPLQLLHCGDGTTAVPQDVTRLWRTTAHKANIENVYRYDTSCCNKRKTSGQIPILAKLIRNVRFHVLFLHSLIETLLQSVDI